MHRIGGKHWKITSTLLIVLLVGAHSGAIAHAYEHDPGSLQDTTCASCVTVGELSSACLDSGVAADIRVLNSRLEADQQLPVASISTLSARQRGPPNSS